jgi:hypothetical protein
LIRFTGAAFAAKWSTCHSNSLGSGFHCTGGA